MTDRHAQLMPVDLQEAGQLYISSKNYAERLICDRCKYLNRVSFSVWESHRIGTCNL